MDKIGPTSFNILFLSSSILVLARNELTFAVARRRHGYVPEVILDHSAIATSGRRESLPWRRALLGPHSTAEGTVTYLLFLEGFLCELFSCFLQPLSLIVAVQFLTSMLFLVNCSYPNTWASPPTLLSSPTGERSGGASRRHMFWRASVGAPSGEYHC